MTGTDLAAVIGAVVLAGAMWMFMFRLDRDDIWPRTWVTAVVVSGYAVGAAFALGHGRKLVGPVSLRELGIGAGVGGAWLVLTHLGAVVLGRIVPASLDEIADLYRLADRDSAARVAGPLVAMAVAEELLFRGLIQGRAGLIVALVAYVAVQTVERKWVLDLAALLCGLIWGGLLAWRHGLVAAIVAHAVWTVALTLIWPIRRADRPPAASSGPQSQQPQNMRRPPLKPPRAR